MRQVAFDPATGTFAYVDYDEETDTFRYIQQVDPTSIIEANQYAYNNAPTTWKDGGGVARIPMVLWQELWNSGRFQDEKAKKRWLNDSDNRKFRTRPGWV